MNPPEEGVPIKVKFTLPETGRQVQAEGTVVWSNEYHVSSKKTSFPGMGIQFKQISEPDRMIIMKYIEDQLSKEHIW